MKFKTKLYLSVGSLLLLITISVVILMKMLEQSTVNMHVVVIEIYDRIEMASSIKYETANLGRELREITAVSNENSSTMLNRWETSNSNILHALETLEKKDENDKSQELITKFKTLHNSYQDTANQILTIQKVGIEADIEPILWESAELSRQRMLQISDLLHGLQEQEMKDELFRSRETYSWAVKMIYIYLAVSLTIGIGYMVWLIKIMTKSLNEVTSVMTSVTTRRSGNMPRLHINTKGEVGAIAIAFNKMAESLESHIRLEKKLKKEAEEQGWLKTKIAEIATMYPEFENMQMLARLIITKLVPMVGANCGVFYIKEVEGKQHYLEKAAAYALSDVEENFTRFRMGEGLIGQCAAEGRPILLDEVPDDYIKIRSGTGGAKAKNIIILPIQFENNVLAVIELASLSTFSSTQIKLLEEITINIGLTMHSLENRMKVEKLLQESQALTEEFQTQSEELQIQQEELRTTNEKLEEQYEGSEQKKKELEKVREALEEKAQQLELSSQYKSEFLANMSHELRTPLNSLLILSQILSENQDGNLTVKQQEYVRTIYSSGHDLLHLINDILDLSKVESGVLEITPKKVELQSVRDFVGQQFSPVAIQKNVEFRVQLLPNLPQSFYTDEQRLQQILKNLLSNAFKFTEGGKVSLVISEKNKQGKAMIAFTVRDTGIGIAKEKQEAIFDAFKQADGTTSRQYGGTGLGLSISREIAYLLDGFIELESEVGKGSTFTLYIPKYRANEIEQSSFEEVAAGRESENLLLVTDSHEQSNSMLKNKKILIVDDDIRNVFALTTALESYEMEIIYAENGREGIDVLKNNPDTDLVLMDIMMPEIDGFEAIRQIRTLSEFKMLPIIAVTAKAMKHNREECMKAGASDYISKPIDLSQLYSLMQVWLYRKKG